MESVSSRIRLLAVACVLLAGGIIASVATRHEAQKPDTTVETPRCPELPARIATPKWLPADLPLPPGSYASRMLPRSGRVDRGIFVVNASLDEFVRFVLAEWPKQGWILGRGDREAHEAEAPLSRPGGRLGFFRARSIYCEPNRAEVLIAVGTAQ